ncbi:MAG: endonuclease [Bacteroidetes bacterium]|nr:MAG: endonuclease [Bacteroidota bacterium]
MAKHNETGILGEQLAVDYLSKNGYHILERNWRFSHLEIDIIALKDNCLVFVEVKTRSVDYLVEPELTLSKKQQGFIIRAANAYIGSHEYDMEARFDIISIVIHPEGHELKHIDEAFYPYAK